MKHAPRRFCHLKSIHAYLQRAIVGEERDFLGCLGSFIPILE
jgi:hypothetical protein